MQNNKIENTERPSADTSSSLVNAQNTQENSGATASYPAAPCSAWFDFRHWIQPMLVRNGRKLWNVITLGTRRRAHQIPQCLRNFYPTQKRVSK